MFISLPNIKLTYDNLYMRDDKLSCKMAAPQYVPANMPQ